MLSSKQGKLLSYCDNLKLWLWDFEILIGENYLYSGKFLNSVTCTVSSLLGLFFMVFCLFAELGSGMSSTSAPPQLVPFSSASLSTCLSPPPLLPGLNDTPLLTLFLYSFIFVSSYSHKSLLSFLYRLWP